MANDKCLVSNGRMSATADDAQRKAMPEAVAKQLQTLEQNQEAGVEFGVVGRGL